VKALAIGNVLGRNLFNITLPATYDFADGRVNFWESLNNSNAFSAVMTMMYRASPRTPYRFSGDGLALIGMYIGSIVTLYLLGYRAECAQ